MKPSPPNPSVPSPIDPRAILDRMPSGVVALDVDRRACYVNPSALAILGFGAEVDSGAGSEVSGWDRGVRALVEHEAVASALEAAGRDGQERRLAIFLTRPDQTLAELGLTVVPGNDGGGVDGEAGSGEAFAAVLLFRALDDSRTLDRRMRDLKQLASVGRLGAGFAHEVLNPAAAIQGLAEGLLDELPDDDPLVEYGERILGLVSRIEGLVRSCVDMGREPMVPPEVVDVANLVTLARCRLEGSPTVRVEVEGGAPAYVTADANQIIQCLEALMVNAVEAMADEAGEGETGDGETGDGEVEVLIRPAVAGADRVAVEVRDRGPGIPDSLLGRVFEPFFTTKSQSTGLGLSVARLAAMKNRGNLEVRSRPGETSFILSLPAGRPGDRPGRGEVTP